MSPIVVPSDPDFRDLEKESVRVPSEYIQQLEEIAERAVTSRQSAFIQIVRWSLDQSGDPPLTEGKALLDMHGTSVALSAKRWKQLHDESGRRCHSISKIVAAHLKRGLDAYAAEMGLEKKPRK